MLRQPWFWKARRIQNDPEVTNVKIASAGTILKIAVAIVLVSSLFACRKNKNKSNLPEIRQIILISIDTLRPDFLGCYNPEKNTSPYLDQFASKNILFTNATSQSSTTAPSHKSILYSAYPSVHKTTLRSVPRETIDSPLANLRSRGFQTAAFVGGGQLHPRSGIEKGFDEYWSAKHSDEKKLGKSTLTELERKSFAWLDAHRSDRFFLFLHTYEVHCPYAPADPYAREFAGWYSGNLDPAGKCGDNYYNEHQMNQEDYRYLRDLYAASVRYVDDFLNRLLQKIKSTGIYDTAMIVILSDHGESLGERGYVGHNQLYERQLRIPLLMRIPGVSSQRVDFPVESIDVMPTIFSFLESGATFPFQGRDLSGVLLKAETIPADRLIISESGKRIRVRRGKWSASFGHHGGQAELYDLEQDAEELKNLADDRKDLVQELWDSYEKKKGEWADLSSHFVSVPENVEKLDPETQEQLEALGYLGE